MGEHAIFLARPGLQHPQPGAWIPLQALLLYFWYNLCLFVPTLVFFTGKSPIFTLELSQKSDFQPSTTKPDNIDHPTVKTEQI